MTHAFISLPRFSEVIVILNLLLFLYTLTWSSVFPYGIHFYFRWFSLQKAVIMHIVLWDMLLCSLTYVTVLRHYVTNRFVQILPLIALLCSCWALACIQDVVVFSGAAMHILRHASLYVCTSFLDRAHVLRPYAVRPFLLSILKSHSIIKYLLSTYVLN